MRIFGTHLLDQKCVHYERQRSGLRTYGQRSVYLYQEFTPGQQLVRNSQMNREHESEEKHEGLPCRHFCTFPPTTGGSMFLDPF